MWICGPVYKGIYKTAGKMLKLYAPQLDGHWQAGSGGFTCILVVYKMLITYRREVSQENSMQGLAPESFLDTNKELEGWWVQGLEVCCSTALVH
jgi:hypothetical protein